MCPDEFDKNYIFSHLGIFFSDFSISQTPQPMSAIAWPPSSLCQQIKAFSKRHTLVADIIFKQPLTASSKKSCIKETI